MLILTDKAFDDLGKVHDGVFVRVAQVDGARVVAVHQFHQAVHQVRHILEGPGLRPITVYLGIIRKLCQPTHAVCNHYTCPLFYFPPSQWPCDKASISRAADRGIAPCFPVWSHTIDLKIW